jgi:fibrillarin-like pre-rRNA processing protein
VYGERLLKIKGIEYREWSPYRSKLAAAIIKGLKTQIKGNILYLGASYGTTASHISDITDGMVYCVEFSEECILKLLKLAKQRDNIVPLFADARKPEEYCKLIAGIDLIYQDVAQPDQCEILIKNAQLFLKKNQYALIAIKAKSIDSVKNTAEIFKEALKKLNKYFKVIEKIYLEPYEKDHLFVVCRL